jgi:hypothetical protein
LHLHLHLLLQATLLELRGLAAIQMLVRLLPLQQLLRGNPQTVAAAAAGTAAI